MPQPAASARPASRTRPSWPPRQPPAWTRVPTLVLGVFLLAAAGPVAAWGGLGHRLVAALAEDELHAPARAEVARLLATEPDPTLAGVATWADELRDHDPGLGRRSAPWHYVNLGEAGCRYRADEACEDGNCVVEAIRAQAAILADRGRDDAERSRALRFLVHFVADVHQPLHAGFGHDRGGNTRQVRLPAGFIPPWANGNPGSNLHSVWDGGLVHSAGLDEDDYLARLRALPLVVAIDSPASPPPAADWAAESCRIVLREGFDPPGTDLTRDYYAAWRPVADERMRLAASRLAATLNAILGD